MTVAPVHSDIYDPGLPHIDLGLKMRGDTVSFKVAAIWKETGLPMDLTGSTIWATFKVDLADGDIIAPSFQLSTASAGVAIVDDPTDGILEVTCAPENTHDLEDTTAFFWDVQVKLFGGPTKTVARG